MYDNYIVKEDLEMIISQKIDFEKLRNKTILITGANGLIASYYTYTLMYLNDTKKLNIKIILLVRNKEKTLKNIGKRNDILILEQDVCDKIEYKEKIDYIIHMASSSNPKTIIDKPVDIIKANVIGTFNVLNVAKDNNAEILFTSTREIYGKVDENIKEIEEEDYGALKCDELRACYPESKRMAENLIISYAYQYNIKYKIARIAHTYGPGMSINSDGRIMSDVLEDAIKNRNIVLKSDGQAIRAFCYIVDTITALFLITVSSLDNQIYNISNETEEISVRDLAYKVKEISNKNIDVKFEIENDDRKYVKFKRVKLKTDKLEKLGWKPIVNLEKGVKRTLKSFEL